ncbi:MAG: right-handed parallel beta-helix repeat-containing protein [Chloroflexi bacterium]|nr:right-handed parallel beta-helix repeat-containing protein [Chloroflexota bacterium]
MRRTLMLSVLLSLALGAIGSAAPPPTDAASGKVVITLPGSVTRGKLTAARFSLPGNFAAVDGRVLVSTKAAEVVGVAVAKGATSMMPVAVTGGYAYGAYGLKAIKGRTYLDVVLLPRKSGRIGIKVTIDSLADSTGRRVTAGAGTAASRTLDVSDASRKAGTRRGTKVYGTGTGSARFGVPAASGRVTPLRTARGLKSLVGTRKISKRDQDYARAGWTQARATGRVCDARPATDPNDDGCSDIVDLQATLATTGKAARSSTVTPIKPVVKPTRPSVTKPTTSTKAEPTKEPAATDAPATEPDPTEEPAATDAPAIEPGPTDEPAATDVPAPDPAASEAPANGDSGKGAAGKGATGKAARPGTTRTAVTSDIVGLTFTVTSTADTADALRGDGVCADTQGRCTLRAAIGEADFLKGDDRVEFNLSGAAPVTIQLTSRLPYITSRAGTLTIDGYSQPGASVNTAENGSNAVLGVEIRGNGGSAREVGLYITSAGNTVRGLVMNNLYRGVLLDGVDAHDNRIIGNWIGFTRTGGNASGQNFGVTLNTGSSHNSIGTPTLANRNVIGNYTHAIESYGAGTNYNVMQNNLLCISPSGARATCAAGIDHNFGPKNGLIGGDGQYERNVIGPTTLQGIEYSHGWDQALPPRVDTSLTYQLRDNSAIGNWVGFRMDGSYDPSYRSGLNFSSADNGQGINVYDGSFDNNILRNYVAATYDGIQVMAPNATGNVVRGNIIGVAPNGDAAPLTGWGIKLRWAAKYEVISGNTIRNAALGGIGLTQDNVYNVRISRNIVTNTNGPAIFLTPTSGSTTNGANALVPPPLITSATTARVSGTGISGALVEVYRANRAAGVQGLPAEFLGDTTVASGGTWKLDITGVAVGQQVSALQIKTDDNTSAMALNVGVGTPPVAPQPGDIILSDDFDRNLAGSWGSVDQGGAWTLTGTAPDFSVSGSLARITAAAGTTREARTNVSATPDVAIIGSVSFDRVPTATNAYAYVLARVNGNSAYRAAIRVATTGRVYVQLKKAINNVESNIGSEVAVPGPLTITAGSVISFRLRVVGADLQFRVWHAGGTEPADWTVTGSDSTAALQSAGSVGIRSYLGSAISNGPVTISLDDFRVRVP